MLIETTKGFMEESLLERREGSDENDHQSGEWVEYWSDGELVHRSVHITIKEGLALFAEQGTLA